VNPLPNEPSTAALFEQACASLDEGAESLLAALHGRSAPGDIAFFVSMASSPDETRQEIALDVLAQVGLDTDLDAPLLGSVHAAILPHLESRVPSLLQAALYATGHRAIPEAIGRLEALTSHPDEDIREAVAFALESFEGPQADAALIRLGSDPSDPVRNAAAFALGQSSRTSTPALLQALRDLVDDPDPETAGEALLGLACRDFLGIDKILARRLDEEPLDIRVPEACQRRRNPAFLPALQRLREQPGQTSEMRRALDRAILACTPLDP